MSKWREEQIDIYDVSHLFRENVSAILICVSLTSYMIGLLNMTVIGSKTFIICSYVGTILLLSGILTKLGFIPVSLRSKGGLSVIFFFISALLFTTAMVLPFIEVAVTLHISQARFAANLTKMRNRQSKYGIDPVGGPGNSVLIIQRHCMWLFQPLLTIGAILLIGAIITQYYATASA